MTKGRSKRMENAPTILYEDNQIIVALKQPNQLTQSDSTGDSDLLSAVKEYVREKYQKPGEAYIGLVHRMDRPVSGLLVFARTSKAAARLSEQVRTHALNREYVCVCEGETPERFRLTDYLKKDEERNMVSVVPDYLKSEGKLAILNGRTIATHGGHSLVAIRLETGRAHQIRVQMQNSGHPLLGDNRYGNGKPGQQIALYGMRLTLEHPTQHQKMIFVAPVPTTPFFKPFERELNALEAAWVEV